MIIYLAGGTGYGWSDRAAAALSEHEVINPKLWSSEPDPAVYTPRDLAAIRRADVILVHMSSANPSGYGMSVEIGYARALEKRIIFWDEMATDWRSRYFGMHREMASVVCHTLEDSIRECIA